MKVKYPVRCQIIDVENKGWRNTPEKSKPHIGKFGLAEKISGVVRITLDDGNILYGFECWWIPVIQEVN